MSGSANEPCCCEPVFSSCDKLNAAGCAACLGALSVEIASFPFITAVQGNACIFPGLTLVMQRFFDACSWRCCPGPDCDFPADSCWCETPPPLGSCAANTCRLGFMAIDCTGTVPGFPNGSWGFQLPMAAGTARARYAPVPNPGVTACPPLGTWQKYADNTGPLDFPPDSVEVA